MTEFWTVNSTTLKPTSATRGTCTYCLKSVDERHHLCYLRLQDPLGEKLEKFKFLFFDFETMQDAFAFPCDTGYSPTAIPNCSACGSFAIKCKDCLRCKNCREARCGSFEHEPNLVIVHSVCHHCFEDGEDIATAKCLECGFRCDACSRIKNGWCADCGCREKVIAGQFCARRLFELIFVKRNRDAKVIAHNGKGFDFHFIMKEMLANGNCPQVIYAGSKIMTMKDHALNIQFLDSLNFLPMKLSQLPKAFGLDDGLAKGFFPHYFNTRPNQSYKGPYPNPEFYGHDDMSPSERSSFLEWHSEQTGTFDFEKEIVEYCRKDVTFLRLACLKFRDMLITSAAVDPFKQCKIASTALAVWKTNCLEEEWEGVIEGNKWDDLIRRAGRFFKDGEDVTAKIKQRRFLRSTVAAMPRGGYVNEGNFSQESIQCYVGYRNATEEKGRSRVSSTP